MKIGTTGPFFLGGGPAYTTLVGKITHEAILAWCRLVDAGPFATLAIGERLTANTLDQFTFLGAAAAATSRVRLQTNITVSPLYSAAVVAKRAATVDVLSGGRLTLGLGVGQREHEWWAAEKPYLRHPQRRLDEQVAIMRRIWAGGSPFPDNPAGSDDRVGPLPVQAGGPPLWTGAAGPKSLARASAWADGYCGFIGTGRATPNGSKDELVAEGQRVEQAWLAAGRTHRPTLTTCCFFALADDPATRLRSMASHNESAQQRGHYWVDNPDAVRSVVESVAAAGYDQLLFMPVGTDLADIELLADAIADI